MKSDKFDEDDYLGSASVSIKDLIINEKTGKNIKLSLYDGYYLNVKVDWTYGQ